MDQMKAEMDVTALVREEIVTDRKIGSIRVFTPITADGYRDETRAVVYMGETQIMTQMGPLPISFEIKAESLADAVAAYGEAATKIVTPGDAGFAQAASKIQMP